MQQVWRVALLEVRSPFTDRLLEMHQFQTPGYAFALFRALSTLVAVQEGRQRVKVVEVRVFTDR